MSNEHEIYEEGTLPQYSVVQLRSVIREIPRKRGFPLSPKAWEIRSLCSALDYVNFSIIFHS